MALFDSGSPGTLEDVLGRQADTASMSIGNQYDKKRRQAISQQAHSGRLGSGVANYTLGDIDAQEVGDLSGVQSNLAEALGGIPTNDYLDEQDFNRKAELARYVASLQKPSTLEQVFGGIGAATKIGATVAGFAG